jgi:soluble lytic murein transglycosylase-like protein
MRPVGLDAVMARIAAVQAGSPRLGEIRSRFGAAMRQSADASAAVADGTEGAELKQTDGGADEAAVSLGSASFMGAVGSRSARSASVRGTYGMLAVSLPSAAFASVARATSTGPASVGLPVIGASNSVGSSSSAPSVSGTVPEASGIWVERLIPAGRAWTGQIQAAASRHGLDPAFLSAVFWTESAFQPGAVSPAGAIGLGQLMPDTARWLGVDPRDPVQNIEGSARFYRQLIDQFGSEELAAAAYFAGPNAVTKAGGIPSAAAADYVEKIAQRRDYLRGIRSEPS